MKRLLLVLLLPLLFACEKVAALSTEEIKAEVEKCKSAGLSWYWLPNFDGSVHKVFCIPPVK